MDANWEYGDTDKAAEYIDSSPSKMTKDRVKGEGPPFIRNGRKIIYRRRDLDRYMEERLCNSTSEYQYLSGDDCSGERIRDAENSAQADKL